VTPSKSVGSFRSGLVLACFNNHSVFHLAKPYCTYCNMLGQFGFTTHTHSSGTKMTYAMTNGRSSKQSGCIFGAALLTLWALTAGQAIGQTFPTKPIRVIVPFPPGGGTDIIAREIATRVATNTGWTLIIENRPGAGGNLGVDAVAKAPRDGYTIALGQTSNLAINPTLYTKLPYDPVKDLAPIALVASSALVFAVSSDSPYKTLADLVAAAKAKPGVLNFASPGNGTVAHLASERFQKAAAVQYTHIAYKGAAQAITDLIGGQVHWYASSVPTLIGHVRTGKLRALAVSSLKRVDDLPNVPTIAESGYKGFDAVTWFGFVAPAGTRQDIVDKLSSEINKALKDKSSQQKLADQGADVLGGTPAQFAQFIKSEIAGWAVVVKEAGTKLD
jgi:tripartite-type tricarboxylate transporter receptor subunit TctC